MSNKYIRSPHQPLLIVHGKPRSQIQAVKVGNFIAIIGTLTRLGLFDRELTAYTLTWAQQKIAVSLSTVYERGCLRFQADEGLIVVVNQ